jgi:hypothetical protein
MAEITTLVDGRKTVAAGGTEERLVSESTPAQLVEITAETDNTGIVVVGASTVVAAQATRRGTPLNAGDTLTLYDVDLYEVHLDVTVNGDGVTFLYTEGS